MKEYEMVESKKKNKIVIFQSPLKLYNLMIKLVDDKKTTMAKHLRELILKDLIENKYVSLDDILGLQ